MAIDHIKSPQLQWISHREFIETKSPTQQSQKNISELPTTIRIFQFWPPKNLNSSSVEKLFLISYTVVLSKRKDSFHREKLMVLTIGSKTLVICYISYGSHGPFSSWVFPLKMVDLSMVLCMFTRPGILSKTCFFFWLVAEYVPAVYMAMLVFYQCCQVLSWLFTDQKSPPQAPSTGWLIGHYKLSYVVTIRNTPGTLW